MDESFLKSQADRCRTLAEKAGPFIKRRLLDLAENYDKRLGRPSRAVLSLNDPEAILGARLPARKQSQEDGATASSGITPKDPSRHP
jgi:hypothetical protein